MLLNLFFEDFVSTILNSLLLQSREAENDETTVKRSVKFGAAACLTSLNCSQFLLCFAQRFLTEQIFLRDFLRNPKTEQNLFGSACACARLYRGSLY